MNGIAAKPKYELWRTAEETLAKFDNDQDNALSLEEFEGLCLELFGEEEVRRNVGKVEEIFRVLDLNADGYLKDDEWQTCYDDWIKVVLSPVNVFLIVDLQNDFIDGSLALKNVCLDQDGVQVVEPINRLIKDCPWHKIIYTLDWHPPDHISFFDNLHMRQLHPDSKVKKEDAKLFDTVTFLDPQIEQKLWPVHCVFDTWGAEIHKDLTIAPDSLKVYKGQSPNIDSYSAFFDNSSLNATELPALLEKLGATDIYMCGLAYDICVCSTCLDGLRLGYRVALIENCCRGVDPKSIAEARRRIIERGGFTVDTDSVGDYVSGRKRSLVMALKGARTVAERKRRG